MKWSQSRAVTADLIKNPLPKVRLTTSYNREDWCSVFLRLVEGKRRAGVVGIATGYGLDDRVVGVRVPEVSRIFSSPRLPD
jgi:hypothetical protein